MELKFNFSTVNGRMHNKYIIRIAMGGIDITYRINYTGIKTKGLQA